MRPILVLSGPIGAGKTTVARALVASAVGPSAYIEGDTFWSFITKTEGTSRQKNFRVIMSAMTAAAVAYALADYAVILDFSMPPWFLTRARAIVAARDVPLDYVVLRPSEAVCAARAAARAEGTIADYTPYRALYTSFDEAAAYTIQDDTSNAAEVAARIREGLDAGRFRL